MLKFLNRFFGRPAANVVTGGEYRSFAAARVDRLVSEWTWDAGFANGDIGGSLALIRSRARDMAKNSEYFTRWAQLYVNNVAGPNGFLLKSTAEKSADDPSLDAAAAAFIETHWARWAGRAEWCDAAGVNNLAALTRLAVDNWVRDGEAFIIIDRHAQNRYGISLRMVRPDCCDETLNADHTANGNIIRNGVEVEKGTWKRVAYWFDMMKADDRSVFVNGIPRIRIPAFEVLHIYLQHDAQQLRGISLSHPFLRKLKMLDEYCEAELVAMKDQACSLGVFIAPAGRETEIANLTSSQNRSQLEQKKSPGSRLVLPQGWDYKNESPTHPNAGLPGAKASMLRDIASGGGVEYANFANDWGGVSFSSVRAGTLAERDQWMVFQNEFKSKVLDRLFDVWLASFLRLSASGVYSMADFDRLSPHDFRGRRWDWVDPMKDVNASVIAVKNGFKTASEVAAEYGGDIDDNIEEKARIDALAKEKCVTLGDKPGAEDNGKDGVEDETTNDEK